MEIEQREGDVCVARSGAFEWPERDPAAAGMDPAKLRDAVAYAQDNRSDGLLVFRGGALVTEAYWRDKSPTALQQTFSGTKSVFALLIGRLIDKGILNGLEQPVSELMPDLPQHLRQLTLENVMAMQSGLRNSPEIEQLGQTGMTQLEIALEREVEAAPFTKYHYNNAPYRLLFSALESATGKSLEELTTEEVFEPLDFDGAYWVRLYAVEGDEERFAGYQSIRMTLRDFAKSSSVINAGGNWAGERYVSRDYVERLVTAPAPEVNPSFGLFHHLNSGAFMRDFDVPERIDRSLAPGAPPDAFLMFGFGGQVTAGIPSLDIVMVRTGVGASIYEAENVVAVLLRMLADAVIE